MRLLRSCRLLPWFRKPADQPKPVANETLSAEAAPHPRVTYGDLLERRKEIIEYFSDDSCHARQVALELIWPILKALESVNDEACQRLVAEEREVLAVCKPYILLHINPAAGAEEIDAAYRASADDLGSSLRPGVTPEEAPKFFRELEQAYNTALRNRKDPSLLAAVKGTYETYLANKSAPDQ